MEKIGEASTEKSLEEELVEALEKRGWQITTVESCTAGALAARIVNVAGASDVLKEGYITYCDEAKARIVGVARETLDKYTAVSAETAKEMALGGLRITGADVAMSVTGLAGPGGGTSKRPVGLVYIGCAIHGTAQVKKLHLQGDRNEIRSRAVEEALRYSLECIEKSASL